MSSIFTKILNKELPGDIVYEQDNLFVIKDKYPKSKTHLLIIPKKEIPTINDLTPEDTGLIADMFFVAQSIAKERNIENGYQLHFNVGALGGQEIFHIHLHLLSDLQDMNL